MAWSNVKLSDVQVEERAELTEGKYRFQLMPGITYRPNKFTNEQEINVSAAVTEHPTLNGKRAFFTYPDPEGKSKEGKPKTWSAQALKRLEIALGVDTMPGEDPVDYLNRAASQNAVFTGRMKNRNFINGNGEATTKLEFSIFDVEPAA